MANAAAIILIPIAYLLGSIPFGLLIARAFTGKDPRQHGSGNIGATNVRRLAGNTAGALTLAGDIAKGALPAALAVHLAGGVTWGASLTALAAFLGHLFPVYFKGRTGGKGVATAAGGLAALAWPVVLSALIGFVAVVAATKRVSVGSLAAAAILPATAVFFGTPAPVRVVCVLIAVLIFLRHHENIRRLLAGTEPSIGDPKP
jgi:glycerol-3-phosphate acyltransferase PlsY